MMTTSASRTDWAAPLAALIASIRHVTGGAPWDVPGIRAELHRAKRADTPDRLAIAAIEWAVMKPDLRAPVGLSEDGPWWHTGRTPDTRVEPTRCAEHPHEWAVGCSSCRSEAIGLDESPTDTLRLSPEQIERNLRGAATVRAALTTTHAGAAGQPEED